MEESPLGSGYEPPRPGYKMTGATWSARPKSRACLSWTATPAHHECLLPTI